MYTSVFIAMFLLLVGESGEQTKVDDTKPAKLLGVFASTVKHKFSMRIPNAPSS